jgi:hypothetical protein
MVLDRMVYVCMCVCCECCVWKRLRISEEGMCEDSGHALCERLRYRLRDSRLDFTVQLRHLKL